MANGLAFTPAGVTGSTFVGQQQRGAQVCVRRRAAGARMMADDGKGFGGAMMDNIKNISLKNPFAKEKQGQFTKVEAGDAGFKAEDTPAKKGSPLPVTAEKRGLALLREDLFKTAPEKAGVGRQDTTMYIRPQYGDPGYKPQAYEVTKVSSLGISPFSDDKNAVEKVGGLEAVKIAAKEVLKGKSAKELKNQALKIKTVEEPKVFDIPDYLKPLPEDTPRKGMTWKNYVGR